MCVSTGRARFGGTTVLIAEKIVDGKLRHFVGYQNSALSLINTPNAMLLHFPARVAMSQSNVLDTSECPNILKDMRDAVSPPIQTRGGSKGVTMSFRAQVFDSGIYTVILAENANQIQAALPQVAVDKRPTISDDLLQFYSSQYSGWSVALCCFNNKEAVDADPLLWWYHPMDEDTFILPGVDSHTGGAPRQEPTQRDHMLIYGSDRFAKEVGQKVYYEDNLTNELRQLLPERVIGMKMSGKTPNGDFANSVFAIRQGFANNTSIVPF